MAEEEERRAALKLPGDVRRPLKATHKPLASLLAPGIPATAVPSSAMTSDVIKALLKKGGSESVVDVSGAGLDSDAWLASLPDALVELDLSSNNLSRLSQCKQLSHLRVLLVDRNALLELSVAALVRLETLSAAHNRLEAVPELRELTRLSCLDLSYNARLTRGFQALEAAKSLRTLDLSHCSLDLSLADLEALLLAPLKTLPKLSALNVLGNPFMGTIAHCQLLLVHRLPQLKGGHCNLEPVTKDTLKLADAEAAKGTWGANAAPTANAALVAPANPALGPSPSRKSTPNSRINQTRGQRLSGNQTTLANQATNAANAAPNSTPAGAKVPLSTTPEIVMSGSVDEFLDDLDAVLDHSLNSTLGLPSEADALVEGDEIDVEALLRRQSSRSLRASDADAESSALASILSPRTALLLAKTDDALTDAALDDVLADIAPPKPTPAPTKSTLSATPTPTPTLTSAASTRSELECKLLAVIESPPAEEIFASFLAKEHSMENLSYWRAVRVFKRRSVAEAWSGARLSSEARAIVERFLSDSADEAVNLDARHRQAALRAASAPVLTPTVFDESAAAALKLMSFDSFQRFLNTSDGQRAWTLASQGKPRGFERQLSMALLPPPPTTATTPAVVAPVAATPVPVVAVPVRAVSTPPITPVVAPAAPVFSVSVPVSAYPWELYASQLSDVQVISADGVHVVSSALLRRAGDGYAQRVLVRAIPIPPPLTPAALVPLMRALTSLPATPLLARVLGCIVDSTRSVASVVYEHVEGTPLRSSLRDDLAAPLSAKELLSLLRDSATALHALHSHGLAHGALTSRVVLQTASGHAVLTDYATAALPTPPLALEAAYCAPFLEATLLAADVRSDLYCLGVILHALLSGKEPTSANALHVLPSTAPPVLARLCQALLQPGAQLVQVMRVLAQRDDLLIPATWTQPKGLVLPPRLPLSTRPIGALPATASSAAADGGEMSKVKLVLDKVAELLASPVPALQLKAVQSLHAIGADSARAPALAAHTAALQGLAHVLSQAGQVGKYDVVEQALVVGADLARIPAIAQAWPRVGVLAVLVDVLSRVDDAQTQRSASRVLTAILDAAPGSAALLRSREVLSALAALVIAQRPTAATAACAVLAAILDDRPAQDLFLALNAWQSLTQSVNGLSGELRIHALAVIAHFHAHPLVAPTWPALNVSASLLALAASPQAAMKLTALRAVRALPPAQWSDAQRQLLLKAAASALQTNDAALQLAGTQLLAHLITLPSALAEVSAYVTMGSALASLASVLNNESLAVSLLTLSTRLAPYEDSVYSPQTLQTLSVVIAGPARAPRAHALTLLTRTISATRTEHVGDSVLCDALASVLQYEEDTTCLALAGTVVAQLVSADASLVSCLVDSSCLVALVGLLDSPRATDRALLASLQALLAVLRASSPVALQLLVQSEAPRVLLRLLSRAALERDSMRVQLAILQSVAALLADPYALAAIAALRSDVASLFALFAVPHESVQLEVLQLLIALAASPSLVPLLRASDPSLVRLRALSVAPAPVSSAVTARAGQLLRLLQ